MIILYGSYGKYIDVTNVTLEKCDRVGNEIVIPGGDYNRSLLYGDPAYGLLKNIVIVHENNNICALFGEEEVRIDYNLFPQTIKIKDQDGNYVDTNNLEVEEQKIVKRFIRENDIVLELGARYGSVSCNINKKLNNKKNQVSVEPDDRVWEALENNKKYNNCDFHIIKGFLSNKKLNLTNKDNYHGGYGSTAIEDSESKIFSYTMDDVKRITGINQFNVLVADCEGFLETFLDENPTFIDELDLFIFEEDYGEKCNYPKIKKLLSDKGFTHIYSDIYLMQHVYKKIKND